MSVPRVVALARLDVTDAVARGLGVIGSAQGDANPLALVPGLINLRR